jgi:hypothetical protein
MQRVTRSVVCSRVAYLNKLYGFADGDPTMFVLDHYQPGCNTRTWKLCVGQRRYLDSTRARWYYLERQSVVSSQRYTLAELEILLNAVIWGVEHAPNVGEQHFTL